MLEARAASHLCSWPADKQYIPISVLELEAPQTVTRVLERYGKGNPSHGKPCRQRIRLRHIEVSIPSGLRLTLAVGNRFYPDRLDHDHRPIAAHNCEEWVVRGLLKGDLTLEDIAIERECDRNVFHDKEW